MDIHLESDSGQKTNVSKVTFQPDFRGLKGFIWISDINGTPKEGIYTLTPFGLKVKILPKSDDSQVEFVTLEL